MKDGFVSTGLTAESPYFKAFEIFGSKQLKYVCHFYVCHDNCDGVSFFLGDNDNMYRFEIGLTIVTRKHKHEINNCLEFSKT